MNTQLTPQQLREMDAWVDIHVFNGGKFVGLKKRGLWYRPNDNGYTYDKMKEQTNENHP